MPSSSSIALKNRRQTTNTTDTQPTQQRISASSSISHLDPFISYIANEKTDDRLKDLFDFYDMDGNGVIQREELIEVLTLCAHQIKLDVEPFLEQIADAVFSNANLNQSGSITFEALKEVLKSRPNLTNELSLARVMQEQKSEKPSKSNKSNDCAGHNSNSDDGTSNYILAYSRRLANFVTNSWDSFLARFTYYFPVLNKLRWEYISNNLTRFNFFLTILLITVILIIGRIISYWNLGGPFLILARCSGQCLNFLCSIIVLLVCRRSISSLRARGFSRYLPLDDNIYFHKLLGLMIIFHSLSHTFGHLVNFYVVSQRDGSKFTYSEYLFGLSPGIGWIGGCASLTGWLLLMIIAAMSLAHPFSRRVGKFELFYYTHLLYIPFWILLFVHAPRFWMWFLAPFAVFLTETLIRFRNLLTSLTEGGQTTIVKAVPLPSDVIHLVIKRPANFEYNPGDWIYVLIPQIAKYEWHPFTISSAPEQEGVIWLHIRAVGEWTRSLRSFFEETVEPRDHLRRFIKSGQFSMSVDQCSTNNFNNPSASDLSALDSAQFLAKNRFVKQDKLTSRFRQKSKPLEPIPEATTSVEATAAHSCSNLSDGTQETTLSSEQSASSLETSAGQLSDKRDRQLKQFCASSSSSSASSSSSSLSTTSCTAVVSTGLASGVTSTDSTVSNLSAKVDQKVTKLPSIKIFIDGPYGSPSSQIFKAEHAVLIATGIGVTPFASILQSIVHHYEKRRQKCPNCMHEFSDNRPPIVCRLRKVDFVWINRDQKSFEWFIKLLAELELTQSHLPPNERFLDIHIHLTAMEPAKTQSIGLQLALYLVHEKNKKDLITGLRTRTRAGRPNWDNFFANIQEQKKGKVTVFFCGRPQLGRILHRQCDSYGFKFRKEIF